MLLKYYKELFSTDNPSSPSETPSHIPHMITEAMNNMLIGEFLECEVVTVLKQTAPLKAPRADGMSPPLYQYFWQVVDHDVVSSILSWLNSGTLPHPINHTFITLIPKVKNPEFVHEYRPISLCNVLYKVFLKALANRLKKLLPHIITKHQSAFAKNRLISNNILIVFETLHQMKSHNSGDTSFIALKLDISKAYDKVE